MDNKTVIRGWTIAEGDYMHARRLEKEAEEADTAKDPKAFVKNLVFSMSAVLVIGSCLALITLFS